MWKSSTATQYVFTLNPVKLPWLTHKKEAFKDLSHHEWFIPASYKLMFRIPPRTLRLGS